MELRLPSVFAGASRRFACTAGDAGKRRGVGERGELDHRRRFAGSAPADHRAPPRCIRVPPDGARRHSPIAGIVLVSADVDGIAGLLTLRERQAFSLYAPASILQVLRDNRIFDVLHPDLVSRVEIAPDRPVDCGDGLMLTLLALPGKTPLYLEGRDATAPERRARLRRDVPRRWPDGDRRPCLRLDQR